MKRSTIIGLTIIILGFAMIAYRGITYTAADHSGLTLTLLGGLAILGGAVVLILGNKPRHLEE